MNEKNEELNSYFLQQISITVDILKEQKNQQFQLVNLLIVAQKLKKVYIYIKKKFGKKKLGNQN